MGIRATTLCLALTGLAACETGCARRSAPSRRAAEPAVTPADTQPSRLPRRYAEGELRPGWKRYYQRKFIRPGETVTVGPTPYARVKLLEVAGDGRSAVFEATHLVDTRRGRVYVGRSFNEFTPIFGTKGAVLEAVDPSGATVLLRWGQSGGLPVPPGALVEPSTRPTMQ